MGLPGPSSEATDDSWPGENFARSVCKSIPRYRHEETSYGDQEISESSNHVNHPVSDVIRAKTGVPGYCTCTVRSEGGLLSKIDGNSDVEDDTVWPYDLSNASGARSKAAVRLDLDENDLYRPLKGAPVAGTPTSIIVGFEALTATSSLNAISNSLGDNANVLQVSALVCYQCYLCHRQ